MLAQKKKTKKAYRLKEKFLTTHQLFELGYEIRLKPSRKGEFWYCNRIYWKLLTYLRPDIFVCSNRIVPGLISLNDSLDLPYHMIIEFHENLLPYAILARPTVNMLIGSPSLEEVIRSVGMRDKHFHVCFIKYDRSSLDTNHLVYKLSDCVFTYNNQNQENNLLISYNGGIL